MVQLCFFLIKSSHCNHPGTMEGGGGSLIFERKCPISNITLKPLLKPNQQEQGIQQLSLRFFLVRTVSMQVVGTLQTQSHILSSCGRSPLEALSAGYNSMSCHIPPLIGRDATANFSHVIDNENYQGGR